MKRILISIHFLEKMLLKKRITIEKEGAATMGLNHAIRMELLEEDYTYKKLHDQHQTLEHEIHNEAAHSAVDVHKLKFLKKKKLFVVDQMTHIERKHSD